jgi:hypothetical protein
MSKQTKNLGLFEYDPTDDGAKTFNLETALNENWDKLDAFAEETNQSLLKKAAAAIEWHDFPFADGFENFNPERKSRYGKDDHGIVHLEVSAKFADGEEHSIHRITLGTLPNGFLPAEIACALAHNADHGYWQYMSVYRNGEMQIQPVNESEVFGYIGFSLTYRAYQ